MQKVFKFNPTNQPIRVELVKNEPYFMAKDVCDCLGIGNITDVMNRLDNDEKLTSIVSKSGQNRQMWFVNESGLYNLIFQSRKPQARAFRKWVTSEVLPQIRKTGEYKPKPKPVPIDDACTLEMLALIRSALFGIRQQDLALECGVTRQTISRVLYGEVRSVKVLSKLYKKALENKKKLQFNPYCNVDKVIYELTK